MAQIREGFASPVGATWRTGYHPTEWYDSNPYFSRYIITGATRYSIHTGIDLQRSANRDAGQPVYSIANGRVTFAARGGGTWGNVVVIEHSESILYSRYAHLENVTVRVGDNVRVGQQIAVIGKSGMGYVPNGEHLHFDISFTRLLKGNPLHWAGDNRTPVAANYVDPTSFLLNAQDVAICLAYPSLRIRNAASLNGSIVGYLPHRAAVRVIGREGGWMQIGDERYVSDGWMLL